MIEERLRKLVVYMGDESEQHELRDTKKVDEVLSAAFSSAQTTNVDNIENFIVKAATLIPNKQHIYALLATFLAKKFLPVGQKLIMKSFEQLQTALNDCAYNSCRNLLLYLAELMNLDVLNSFIFFSLLQDIVNELEKCQNEHKMFYLRLLARVLPVCWCGLQVKLGQELRKMIDKIKKSVEGLNPNCDLAKQWKLILDLYQNGKLKDFSKIGSLKTEELQNIPQYNPQIKLSFKDRKPTKLAEFDQHQLILQDQDKLYQQFSTSLDAYIHRDNIAANVQSFWQSKKVLNDKLILYIFSSQNGFMSRFVIETLFRQALLNANTSHLVIYSSLLVQLSNEIEETLRNDLRKATQETVLAIFSKLESYDINIAERLAEVVSIYIANFSSIWDWSKWAENSDKFVIRSVFLKLTFEKVIMLSEKALGKDNTKEVAGFIPQSKFCLSVRESKEQTHFMSKMADRLAEKADSDVIISAITNLNEYEMFLECLMTRMSSSNTHLLVLSERYRKVFEQFARKYEKPLIASISNFWANSQFHKVQYLALFIEKKIINFQAFVEWLSMEAKVSEEPEKLLLRRLYNKVKDRCNPNFDDKEMIHELEQSLA